MPELLVRNFSLLAAREFYDKQLHAFVTSCIDYCNAVYAMPPQTVTNRL